MRELIKELLELMFIVISHVERHIFSLGWSYHFRGQLEHCNTYMRSTDAGLTTSHNNVLTLSPLLHLFLPWPLHFQCSMLAVARSCALGVDASGWWDDLLHVARWLPEWERCCPAAKVVCHRKAHSSAAWQDCYAVRQVRQPSHITCLQKQMLFSPTVQPDTWAPSFRGFVILTTKADSYQG